MAGRLSRKRNAKEKKSGGFFAPFPFPNMPAEKGKTSVAVVNGEFPLPFPPPPPPPP